jgi:hypothetical protein
VAVADARGLIESRNLVAVHGLSPSGPSHAVTSSIADA